MRRDPMPYAPRWQSPMGVRKVVIEVAADRYTPLDCLALITAWITADPIARERFRAWTQAHSGYPNNDYPIQEVDAQLFQAQHFLSQIDTFPGHVLYVGSAEGMVN